MSIKLGITGGIGSGKSVVTHLLQVMDIPVYYTDDEAKRLMVQDPDIRRDLIAFVGEEVYGTDGSLNRKMLAEFLFGYPERVKRVNRIVHPRVKADFEQWAGNQKTSVVAMECAILYESGFNEAVDKVVGVTASLSTRLARATKRDSASVEQIKRRIAHQLPQEELCMRADYLIDNEEDSLLIPQVLHLLEELNTQLSPLKTRD